MLLSEDAEGGVIDASEEGALFLRVSESCVCGSSVRLGLILLDCIVPENFPPNPNSVIGNWKP